LSGTGLDHSFDVMPHTVAGKGTHPGVDQIVADSRWREELAANPDNAEEAAERQLPHAGRGAARSEALGANPDLDDEETARRLPPSGDGSHRAEALGANPDTDEEEAWRSLGKPGGKP
jgi:hypothetical protein